MSGNTQLSITLVVVAISFLCGLYRYRLLDTAGKVIVFLLFAVFTVEVVAHWFAKRYHNNLGVYNIFGLIEISFIILYFGYSNNFFGNKRIVYFLLIFGLLLGVTNFAFFESFTKLNSIYLFFEGFTTIVLALVSFYRMLLFDEELRLHKHPHFWFASVFLFFWSITYLNWGLFPLLKNQQTIEHVIFFIWIVNIVTYGSIGVIFQLYPKKV